MPEGIDCVGHQQCWQAFLTATSFTEGKQNDSTRSIARRIRPRPGAPNCKSLFFLLTLVSRLKERGGQWLSCEVEEG